MKKFIKQLSLFLIITFSICIVFILLLYNKIDKGNYYKIDKNIKNIIVGHSHTECAFNDTIIKNTLNVANPAEEYYYIYFKLKKIIENNKIDNVFISFSNNQIDVGADNVIAVDRFIQRSYTKYAANIDFNSVMILLKKNPTGLIANQPIAVKKYCSYLLKNKENIIKGNFWGKFNYLKRYKLDSLLKVKSSKVKPIKSIKYSDISFQYLEKIIALCKANNVKIYLVRCPVHSSWEELNNEYFFQKIIKTRFKNQEFLDFKDFPLLIEDYGDQSHLNYKGSTKFSNFFQKLIKKGLFFNKNKQEFINQEMKKEYLWN